MKNHEVKAATLFSNGFKNPPDERKEGNSMMTY